MLTIIAITTIDVCTVCLQIHDTYFLVAIIDNDFIDSTLFELLPKVMEHHRRPPPSDTTDEAASEATATSDWF